MTGYGNHRLLQGESVYQGKAYTKERYVMLNLGGIPGVVFSADVPEVGAYPIIGEVYKVSPRALASMDRLEGHPNCYRRTTIQVMYDSDWKDEEVVSAYIWNFSRLVRRSNSQINHVPTGNWRTAYV